MNINKALMIADRSAEIQRLEILARGMRTSYLHPSTPPRLPHKSSNGNLSPLNTSNNAATNGTDENRLAVRSPSTSKMITFLQREMDTLKASSEAARGSAGSLLSARRCLM
jgi:hypothetical protein